MSSIVLEALESLLGKRVFEQFTSLEALSGTLPSVPSRGCVPLRERVGRVHREFVRVAKRKKTSAVP